MDKIRKEFEELYGSEYKIHLNKMKDGRYQDHTIRHAWEVYKKCSKSRDEEIKKLRYALWHAKDDVDTDDDCDLTQYTYDLIEEALKESE